MLARYFNVVLCVAVLAARLRVAEGISWQFLLHDRAVSINRSVLEPAGQDVDFGLRKPPRIFRTGSISDQTATEQVVDTQTCGKTKVVDSKSNKDARCPEECPFFVQDKKDDKHCSFQCVTADQCTSFNPRATVADPVTGACRPPMANFCKEYDTSGEDKCAVCKRTYALDEEGQCHFEYMWALYGVAGLLGLIVLVLLAFVCNLGCREAVNKKGLKDGLLFRSGQKLRYGEDRQAWPLDTNLCKQEVAGPGMLLHFNFQMVLIIWAFGVAALWTIISIVEDPTYDPFGMADPDNMPDLMRLGTRRFGMPRENCILVAWGYETQMRLMWVKIGFLVVVYLGSFGLAIYHSIRQLRLFENLDRENTTMSDFAVVLAGLPRFDGVKDAESEIRQAVKAATGVDAVGVSIAWDFKDVEEDVIKAAKETIYDIDHNQEARDKDDDDDDEDTGAAERGNIQQKLYDFESRIFGIEDKLEEAKSAGEVKALLEGLSTTQFAFVVFKTEAQRNAAVEKVQDLGGTFKVGENDVKMEEATAEPDTVQWENFGHADFDAIVKRLAIGLGCIFLGLLLWTTVFYAPYAWSIFNFNYDNGNQPGFIYGFAFSMVVVIGNAIMYEICARVSDYVGFHYRDNREACYMILYTVACTFNILLDFVTTYYIVWEMSKGLGFRSYHGTKLRDIDDFTDQFETYAIQRLLGENTYSYAFPSTFLIPFLIEPFITIYLPLKIGLIIVRSHPELVGGDAEEFLAAIPMDMGRYADCLLDVVLAVLVLYFPGGWTWKLFFALGFCHMFIYAFDHWKVLRNIPRCTYASMDVDWWSQAMFAPCVATIGSCMIFKANCQGYGYCVEGVWELVPLCSVFWILHCVVHLLILVHVVPRFGEKVVGSGAETNQYEACAKETPCTWFTANPVHCLRSKYIRDDTPACMYFIAGKEHCQKVNPKVGTYFSCTRAEMEEYDEGKSFSQAALIVRRKTMGLMEKKDGA